ncbi:hypothetical protein EHQ53_15250 [Leptospira langatensis]|uniref:Uncharacterized protein n=2 Tax=Leptospira langatensis TaxID=2484983 RepID=A0A5F1ZQC7_9LEPT|nr:hypothetical protein [Leptospira langatensis]TGK01826.1 hypothetical protein EHO57_08490 [Leptospira langatensis]TGL39543.1 hypothetical protein EHQ53_15250 [Leptospira langatensis]
MTKKEKILYHQIHPFKLFTDFFTGFLTTYFAWEHSILWFLAFFLLPSIVVTLIVIRFSDLDRLKDSAFGNYVRKYMDYKMQTIRSVGQLLMWCSAWFHLPFLILLGFLLIMSGWMNGLIRK